MCSAHLSKAHTGQLLWPLLLQDCYPLRWRGHCREGGAGTHTWSERNQLRPDSQGFSSSTSGPNLTQIGQGWPRSLGQALAHTWLALSTLSPAPPPTKVMAGGCALEEYMTLAHFRSSSPTRGAGSTHTTQGCSPTGPPFRVWDSYLLYLIP